MISDYVGYNYIGFPDHAASLKRNTLHATKRGFNQRKDCIWGLPNEMIGIALAIFDTVRTKINK